MSPAPSLAPLYLSAACSLLSRAPVASGHSLKASFMALYPGWRLKAEGFLQLRGSKGTQVFSLRYLSTSAVKTFPCGSSLRLILSLFPKRGGPGPPVRKSPIVGAQRGW